MSGGISALGDGLFGCTNHGFRAPGQGRTCEICHRSMAES